MAAWIIERCDDAGRVLVRRHSDSWKDALALLRGEVEAASVEMGFLSLPIQTIHKTMATWKAATMRGGVNVGKQRVQFERRELLLS